MRHLKIPSAVAAFVVMAVLLGLTGCDDDHEYRVRGDRGNAVHRDDRYDGHQYQDRNHDSNNDRGEHHGQ